MIRPAVQVTGGFWVLLGGILFLHAGALLPWLIPVCLVHELGHIAAIRGLGGTVRQFRLTGTGAVLLPNRRRMFSYREEILIALSGPLASFLFAVAAAGWSRYFGGRGAALITGLSLALGVFNLIPAGPLDGGRVLCALSQCMAGPGPGERFCTVVTTLLSVILVCIGIRILFCTGNFTLLVCAIWLFTRKK